MKVIKQITNGIIIMLIGALHTHGALSSGGFGIQFREFSKSCFYKISPGLDEFPAMVGRTNFETHAAFWFFYFGILMIPLGLLLHTIEKEKKIIPHSFVISYFMVVLIGCYMIPQSGMTYFMLPHAIYMLVSNCIKARKAKVKL